LTFFGMKEASNLAISKFGYIARCWNDPGNPSPKQRCRIGTGGAGMSHILYGHGETWLEAADMACLFSRELPTERERE